jgi:hypothetical protein
MSLNPNAPRFYSTSPSVSPTPMEKKEVVPRHERLGYAFPYTLRPISPQKPFQMTVIHNTHFRPIRS